MTPDYREETDADHQPEDSHPHVAVWLDDVVYVGCLEPAPDLDDDDALGDIADVADQDPGQPVAAEAADASMTLGHGGPGDGSEPGDWAPDEDADRHGAPMVLDRLSQPYRSFAGFAAGPIATARARDWRPRP